MMTPMDVHNKEFETGFRGYSKESVDAFMNELKVEFEALYRGNREMTERMEQLEKRIAQYEQMEETMNNTLALAKETGENVKESARKEAELIIQEAQAQKVSLLEEAERNLRETQEKFTALQHEMSVFRVKSESLLNAQLQMLEGIALEKTTTAGTGTEEDINTESVVADSEPVSAAELTEASVEEDAADTESK